MKLSGVSFFENAQKFKLYPVLELILVPKSKAL